MMSLSPALLRMVADAQAKYDDRDPLVAKRAEILAPQADNHDDEAFDHPSVMEQLMILGLRKATKGELRHIVMGAMAAGV